MQVAGATSALRIVEGRSGGAVVEDVVSRKVSAPGRARMCIPRSPRGVCGHRSEDRVDLVDFVKVGSAVVGGTIYWTAEHKLGRASAGFMPVTKKAAIERVTTGVADVDASARAVDRD